LIISCAACTKPFNEKEPFVVGLEKENAELYCSHCWTAKFAPKCHMCSKAITGKCVHIGDKYFHPEHFLCLMCKTQLTDKFEMYKEKQFCLVCKPKFVQMETEGVMFCGECRFIVHAADSRVNIHGTPYHLHHHRCRTCRTYFTRSSDAYVCDGAVFCKAHYDEIYPRVCPRCDVLVSDDDLTTAIKGFYGMVCMFSYE